MNTSSQARKSPRRPAPITGVLCGTDFSENARAAADVGAQLAHAWEQPLTLAHATLQPDPAAARTALSREGARLRKSSSAGILTRLVEGEPSEVLAGRTAVAFDDIKSVALPALRHRILLNFEAEAEGRTTDEIVQTIVDTLVLDAR